MKCVLEYHVVSYNVFCAHENIIWKVTFEDVNLIVFFVNIGAGGGVDFRVQGIESYIFGNEKWYS